MSRPQKTNAGPNQLREELRQQLLTTFAANKRDSASGDGPQPAEDSCPGPSGEPSDKEPFSVASATTCNCHKFDDVHVHVTLLCQCSRPTTADRATQTDEVCRDYLQRSTTRGVGTSADHLQAPKEVVICETRSKDAGASVEAFPNGTPTTPRRQDGIPNGAGSSAQAYEAEVNDTPENSSKEEWSTPRRVIGVNESPRMSPADRRRSVHEALARVRDTLFEALQDTPRAMAATSNAGMFEGVFPTMPTSPPPSPREQQQRPASPLQAQASGEWGAVANPILDPIAEEEGMDPPCEARRIIISEEMTTIFDHIESRWTNVCEQLRMDLNGRYNQFLEDCRSCLKSEQGGCERDQLRHEMADARRELIAEMKENFRTACEAFDEWRERYLQGELQTSCTALHQGDRYRVLSAVLRLEILDSLPDQVARTRALAAALWKELVEQWGADVEELFNEEL